MPLLYPDIHLARLQRLSCRAGEALRAAEMLCVTAGLEQYPAAAFDEMWRILLNNQFSDSVPGFSSHRAYAEIAPQLEGVVARCKALQIEAAGAFLEPAENVATYFNPSSTVFSGTVVLPEGWKSASVDGEALLVQREADNYIAWLDVPAQGFISVDLSKTKPTPAETAGAPEMIVLENDQVRYVLDAGLHVVSCFDKTVGVELIAAGQKGNVISLFTAHLPVCDVPGVESDAQNIKTEATQVLTIETIQGPVRNGVMACLKLGESIFMQTAWLGKTGKRLDFETYVDWRENHKIARVSFPVDVHTHEAQFERQCGTTACAMYRIKTSHSEQGEVLGHRYADVSESKYGVALLNDGKGGYSVKDDNMTLTLLRAPTQPDPVGGVSSHYFVYSLLPHEGPLSASDIVLANAAVINQGLEVFVGFRAGDRTALPVSLVGKGVELAFIKRDVKDNCLIVRLVEQCGRRAQCVLSSIFPDAVFVPCANAGGEEAGDALKAPIALEFHPFEIKTFKVLRVTRVDFQP